MRKPSRRHANAVSTCPAFDDEPTPGRPARHGYRAACDRDRRWPEAWACHASTPYRGARLPGNWRRPNPVGRPFARLAGTRRATSKRWRPRGRPPRSSTRTPMPSGPEIAWRTSKRAHRASLMKRSFAPAEAFAAASAPRQRLRRKSLPPLHTLASRLCCVQARQPSR